MNLQDLGAIGDLVGGIAVVVSLIYVGHQIRQNSRQIEQNSRQMEASMYNATNDAFCSWHALLAQDEKLANLWRRALDGEDLPADELARIHPLLTMLFLAYENNFQQLRLGAVNRNTFAIGRPALSALMTKPIVQAWWKRQGRWILTPEFREAMESLVREVAASKSDAQQVAAADRSSQASIGP